MSMTLKTSSSIATRERTQMKKIIKMKYKGLMMSQTLP